MDSTDLTMDDVQAAQILNSLVASNNNQPIIGRFINFEKISSLKKSFATTTSAIGGDDCYFKSLSSAVDFFCPSIVKIELGPLLENILHFLCYSDNVDKSLFGINEVVYALSKTDKDRENIFIVEAVLKAAFVYLSFMRMNGDINREIDEIEIDEFVSEYFQYPTFAGSLIDSTEMGFLITFRKMMKTALRFIPAERNKKLLLTICAFLEGSGRKYVTGGTQSLATHRRIEIYQHESGCRKRRRPERQVKAGAEKEKETDKEAMRASLMISCECGSVILKRTMWKHCKSSKHQQYLRFANKTSNASSSSASNSSSSSPTSYPFSDQQESESEPEIELAASIERADTQMI